MKKKLCIIAVIVVLCMTIIFSVMACDGESTNEVQEYKGILEKVVTTYYDKYNAETDTVEISLMSAMQTVTYPQDVFAVLNAASNKEEISDPENYEAMALNGLLGIWAYVDSFEEVYGLEKFYGVTIYQPSYEDNQGATAQPSYITVESKGNHKIAYIYGGGSNESIYVYDIEFIDDSTFSITMLTIASNDGELENMYYIYTDTQDMFVSYLPNEGKAIYGDGSNCYLVVDETALANCDTKVKPKFDAIDVETIRAYENNTDYPITREQYMTSIEKLKTQLQERSENQ